MNLSLTHPLTVTCCDPPPTPKVAWMTRECSIQLPMAANTTTNRKAMNRARIPFSFTTRAHPIDIVTASQVSARQHNVGSTLSVHGTGRSRSTARWILSIQLLLADPSRRFSEQQTTNWPGMQARCSVANRARVSTASGRSQQLATVATLASGLSVTGRRSELSSRLVVLYTTPRFWLH